MKLDEWKTCFAKTAVFLAVLDEMTTKTTIESDEVQTRLQMFQDGDYDQEFEAYLSQPPPDFSYIKTTLHEAPRAKASAMVDVDEAVSDAHMAAEKAAEALYDGALNKTQS